MLLFFGLVGVIGTYYLHVSSLDWQVLLPALSCGFFAVGVLNVNNIRDIHSDQLAGKYSIPVRIGRENAVIYHWSLILVGLGAAVVYTLLNYERPTQWIFLLSAPLFIRNAMAVQTKRSASELDPFLKQLAISTLLFVLTFGFGLIYPL